MNDDVDADGGCTGDGISGGIIGGGLLGGGDWGMFTYPVYFVLYVV